MRRFTKEHNDLDWLFPDPSQEDYEKASDVWFDTYEDLANNLFETCYGNQETFTKDDMIDSFMKGASEAHAFLASKITEEKNIKELHKLGMESSAKLEEIIQELINKLDNKDNEIN